MPIRFSGYHVWKQKQNIWHLNCALLYRNRNEAEILLKYEGIFTMLFMFIVDFFHGLLYYDTIWNEKEKYETGATLLTAQRSGQDWP